LDLAEMAAGHAVVAVVDVRTPAEYEAAHIPGSHNVPLDLVPRHAGDLGTAIDGTVVLVCRSGGRARQAPDVLWSAGLPRVHVLDGGIVAWESAGLPLDRGRERWDMERQVRGVAAAVALASAAVGLFVWRPVGGIAAGIGGGLLLSTMTNSCAMANLLGRLPHNSGARCDIGVVVQALGRPTETATLVSTEGVTS